MTLMMRNLESSSSQKSINAFAVPLPMTAKGIKDILYAIHAVRRRGNTMRLERKTKAGFWRNMHHYGATT